MTYSNHFPEQNGTYLLSHSVGLPPENTHEAITRDLLAPWQAANHQTWDHWLTAIDEFRDQLAILLETGIDNICPQTNVSSAVTKILQSLPYNANRRKILLSEADFPSVAFSLQHAMGGKYELVFIPKEEDLSDLSTWDKYLADDIKLTLITHVQSNNGCQIPIQQVSDRVKQCGSLTLVDAAQSLSVLPINLSNWQPDFLLGSCVKWTCGGPGAAFLWLSDQMISSCSPHDVGWFSHEMPFEFDIHNFRYASTALKFWGGTPSVAPFVIAANSLKLINEISLPQIRSHNVKLQDMVISALPAAALVSPVSEAQRSGTLILNFGEQQDKVIAQLEAENIHFDTRSSGIRISPHIYNSEVQIADFIRLLGV